MSKRNFKRQILRQKNLYKARVGESSTYKEGVFEACEEINESLPVPENKNFLVSPEQKLATKLKNSEENLSELNEMLSAQSIIYIKHLKTLLKGNVEKNLSEILGTEIIMNFNVEGTFGKKRLRKYENVYAALIDAISSISAEPDKTLKAAFQRQKKRIFKQKSRNKEKQKENLQSGAGSLLLDEENESS